GIGLNINQPRSLFEEAGLPLGGSLAERSGRSFERDAVAGQLLAALDREYTRLLNGDLATLQAYWKRHLGLLGKTVVAELYGQDQPMRGRLVEIAFAALEFAGEQDRRELLTPERIRHLAVDPT